jgi:hypothetical protein
MNYKSFNLGDWIGHISGVIEDETTLDGNEMRDLVEFLTTLKQEPVLDKIRAEINTMPCAITSMREIYVNRDKVINIIDKHKAESEE